jgi:hypothetical protein
MPGKLSSDNVSPTVHSAEEPRALIVGRHTAKSLPSPGIKIKGVIPSPESWMAGVRCHLDQRPGSYQAKPEMSPITPARLMKEDLMAAHSFL